MDNALLSFFQQAKDLVTDNRPLRLRLAHPTQMLDDVLLPQYVQGSESICGSVEFRILCVSLDAFIPLKELIALPVAVDIVTDRGDLRSICGIVTEARAGDSDGGLASYQLVMRDALSIMEKRTNTRVFRNKNEVEIVQVILDEWRMSNSIIGGCFNYEMDDLFACQKYPQREFTMQYNESDAAFIRRLLKRRGIAWYFRSDGAEYPAHTMVLFNHPDSLPPSAAGTIRYHRDNATEERDTITSWCAVRSLQAGCVSRFSWDYKRQRTPDLMSTLARSKTDQGPYGKALAASLDDYHVQTPHAGDDYDDLIQLGQLAMKRHVYETKCFHAKGTVRDLGAGETFFLEGHPEIDKHAGDEQKFIATSIELEASNNLPKAVADRMRRIFVRMNWPPGVSPEVVSGDQTRFRIRIAAVRAGIDILPAFDPRADLPQVPMQSATVVGPEGEEVYCDKLGRVKIRFKWTRDADHAHAQGLGAADREFDSAWVRVASNWAGDYQCGNLTLPRVGSEVLVSFLAADPDKPVIVAQLYNQSAQPPGLSPGGGLPGNRYLSGIKSREIKGERGNQLVLDDTANEISAQLGSDHAESQLNLGFLTEARKGGHGEHRGDGAELITQASVAIRGVKGVLMTAFPGSPASTSQLERSELNQLLTDCEALSKALAEYAAAHRALASEAAPLTELKKAAQQWDGETGKPIVAITAPEGIIQASGSGMASYAAANLDQVAQKNLQFAAGKRCLLSAGKGISLFAHADGIHQIAHKGRVLIQSQSDGTDINASKDLTLTSSEGKLVGMAKEIVLVAEDGSFLKIGNGITIGTSGTINYHASKHPFKGGKTMRASLPKFESGGTNLRVVTAYEKGTPRETVAPNKKVKIEHDNGNVVEAKSNSAGKTSTMSSDEMHQVVVTPLEPEER